MDEDTGLVRVSVAYPLAGDGARSRLVRGAALQLAGAVGVAVAAALLAFDLVAPVAWVPVAAVVVLAGYVPLLGYAAAAVRSLLAGEADPPGIDGVADLLLDGRRLAAVVGLYALPAVLLATAAVALGGGAPGSTPVSLGAAALAGLLALAALYVLPAAAVLVVDRGEPSAALDRGVLRAAVGDRRYLGPWLLGVAGVAVGTAVAAPLAVVAVGLAVAFTAHTAAVHAVTHGVVRSLEWPLEDPPAPPASGYIPGWDDGADRKELSEGRLGGSLLPTTPDGDGEDAVQSDEPAAPAGDLAADDDGGAGGLLARNGGDGDGDRGAGGLLARSADGDGDDRDDAGVDPTAGAPDDGTTTGSDITPFVEGDGDIERADEED